MKSRKLTAKDPFSDAPKKAIHPLAMRKVDDAEFQQHLKNLNIYGYTIVPALLAPSLVKVLKTSLEHYWKEAALVKYAGRPSRDVKDKMVYNLQNKHKVFIDLLSAPFISKICSEKLNDKHYRFIPEEKPNYILNYYNARSSGNKLDLHIDACVPNPSSWCIAMQVVYVLEDMNEGNGCTIIVPGSHRSGEFTDRGLEKVTPVIAKAGDVVLWDSKLWHGTMENTNGKSRWALIATLTQWWMKQSMDITKSLPQEIYGQLSDEQKALMGFCSIPPSNEHERINTKCGYDALKPSVSDYQ